MASYNFTLPNTGQFYFSRGSHQGRNWSQLINSTLVNARYMYMLMPDTVLYFSIVAHPTKNGFNFFFYNICTILYNICHCQVFNQVFNTHYNLNFTKLSVVTYKELVIFIWGSRGSLVNG